MPDPAATHWGLSGAPNDSLILVGRRLYPIKAVSGPAGPVIEVAVGERVSWVGRASVRWPLFLVGGAVIVYSAVPGWGAWLGALLVLLAILLTRVEASVDDTRVTVRLGGIPVRRIPLSSIASARPIDLEPSQWGGWGWRASPNGSAIVLRRGDALELTFLGGRRFAVTIDDSVTGAALVNGLLARLGREG